MGKLYKKHCFKCKKTKAFSKFYKNSGRPDGLDVYCIACVKILKKGNPAKKAWEKAYRKKNFKKIQKRNRLWRQENIDKIRKYRKKYCIVAKSIIKNRILKRVYGINVSDYLFMQKSQKNVCKICKKPEIYKIPQNGKIRDLTVDHCHKTGKVRGLLCNRCNQGLGIFKDSIENLKQAIKYLGKAQK